jgi:predicted Zn-ribbon and HTH transcriptional regulator
MEGFHMAHRITNDVFKQRVKEQVGDEYIFLEEYISIKEKMLVRHNVCNKTYSISPDKFLNRKTRCLFCAGNRKYQEIEIMSIISEITTGEYVMIGDYKNAITKVLVKHLKCDYEFYTIPNNFINKGSRCPRCAKNERYNNSQFIDIVKKLSRGEYNVIGEYTGAHKPVQIEHRLCGHVYMVKPSNFIHNNRRCPKCKESKGESDIELFLQQNNVRFKKQYRINECKNKQALPFDFAIFDDEDKLIFLIEYDGEQHFYSIDFFGGEKRFESTKKNDSIKNKFCLLNNIPLLRIKYDDKKNINNIVNSF